MPNNVRKQEKIDKATARLSADGCEDHKYDDPYDEGGNENEEDDDGDDGGDGGDDGHSWA